MEMFSSFEVTSMSSVLLSLSLNIFAVAQAMTSPIYDCIERSSYVGDPTSVIVSHQQMNGV